MDGIAALVLMLSAVAVLLVEVESEQRVCYFGSPPEPDPDNPDDWMKQFIQEIRKRCPGRRQPTSAECSSPQPLGMEDGTIQDDHITASSSYDCCPASAARLNNNFRWAPDRAGANPWIEVNLVVSTVVTGVITQGWLKPADSLYVKRYMVAYQKHPPSHYEHVTDGNGNIKVFMGNTDSDTPVTNMFDESVVATVVRIEPTQYENWYNLRLELLGCRRD